MLRHRHELHRRRLVVSGAALLGAALTTAAVALAQGPGGGNSVTVSAVAQPVAIAHGGKGQILVTLTPKPGWHVYSANPGSSDFIPTTIEIKGADGVTVGKPKFPVGKPMKADPKPVQVYEGKTVIAVPFTVAATAKPGKRMLNATVGYQTCNDKMCLPPDSKPLSVAVTVK